MRSEIRAPRSRATLAAAVPLLGVVLAACAINPVTGKKELSLVPESQEIEMGRAADRQIVATMGLHRNDAVQAYVSRLGRELAARSERPQLPWTFRVIDDPIVNAFALPGGFVYVTRGLMTHLNSEAELVAVLGHEIGHVTAKHGVAQMSRAQIAQVGLGVGSVLAPGHDDLAGLATQGLGLAFLKFGRDDERQADDIGLRYMVNAGYDPRPMAEVFDTLARVSAGQGAGRIPAWLSTHPAPEDRRSWAGAKIAGLALDLDRTTLGREGYLAILDGMTFGENPRQGYFKGDAFYHPDMAFRFEVPAGWTKRNSVDAVRASSPAGDLAVQVTLAQGESPQSALDIFIRKEGVQAGSAWQGEMNGLQAVSREFQTASGTTKVEGVASFIKLDARVFQIVGYGSQTSWGEGGESIHASLASFRRLTDPKILAVRPWTIEIVQAPQSMTLESFAAKYPGPVPVATLALINHMEPASRIAAGSRLKRVAGEKLP